MRKRKTDYRPVHRAMAMISQFGINMIVPICLTSAIGIWLDEKLGTSYWMVVLFFVGAIAGFRNVYIVMKSFWKSPEKEEAKEVKEREQRDAGKNQST